MSLCGDSPWRHPAMKKVTWPCCSLHPNFEGGWHSPGAGDAPEGAHPQGSPTDSRVGSSPPPKPQAWWRRGTQALLLTSSPLRYSELALTGELGWARGGCFQWTAGIPDSQPVLGVNSLLGGSATSQTSEGTKAPQRAKGLRGERVTAPMVVGSQDGGEKGDFYSHDFAQVTSHHFLNSEGDKKQPEQRALGSPNRVKVPSSVVHIPAAWTRRAHPLGSAVRPRCPSDRPPLARGAAPWVLTAKCCPLGKLPLRGDTSDLPGGLFPPPLYPLPRAP